MTRMLCHKTAVSYDNFVPNFISTSHFDRIFHPIYRAYNYSITYGVFADVFPNVYDAQQNILGLFYG